MQKTARILYFASFSVVISTLIYAIVYTLSSESGTATLFGAKISIGTLTVALAAMILPPIIIKWKKVSFSPGMILAYLVFVMGSIYGGSGLNLFWSIPHFDTLMHAFSGGMLAALGFMLICSLHKTEKLPRSFSPLFLTLFVFCFSMTIGVLWELIEFGADYFTGGNMLRWAEQDGTPHVGLAALYNTMWDFIANAVGAAIVAVMGYISLKNRRRFVDTLVMKKKKEPK